MIFTYFSLPNSRTVSNKRTGWKICQKIINAQDLINAQAINKTNMTYKVKKRTGWEIFLKLINAQCLISSHRTDFFLKKNKRTCATIRQVRVHTYTQILFTVPAPFLAAFTIVLRHVFEMCSIQKRVVFKSA